MIWVVDQAVLSLVLFGVSPATGAILSNMVSLIHETLACKSKRSEREVKLPVLSKAGPELAQHRFHCIWLVKAIIVLALIQEQEEK